MQMHYSSELDSMLLCSGTGGAVNFVGWSKTA